mgnify:CR=1 FL=1|tara:strand:- start:4306 stop:4506 length:201 start_codon:yes stop_codon:yes gene_type:complete
MINMNVKSFEKIQKFLKNELGLDDSSILLGLKLSNKNKSLLPVSLWSYGIIDHEELDRFYKFLYEN